MSILVMLAQFLVLYTVATKELNFKLQYEDLFEEMSEEDNY